jgi:hypothetical protein
LLSQSTFRPHGAPETPFAHVLVAASHSPLAQSASARQLSPDIARHSNAPHALEQHCWPELHIAPVAAQCASRQVFGTPSHLLEQHSEAFPQRLPLFLHIAGSAPQYFPPFVHVVQGGALQSASARQTDPLPPLAHEPPEQFIEQQTPALAHA